MMIDAILNNLTTITICGFTFLVGVGIGGGITDALNKWTRKGEKSNETQLDSSRKEIPVDGHDKQRDI